jgi:predicted pyridoxine 5'-phosphate oxidase superfamily flavin-nucleotide-binding protein
VHALSSGGFTVEVDQSFGNCPKYISARTAVFVEPQPTAAATAQGERLSDAAAACVAAADTCFIASASASVFESGDAREGVDVSHRGGKPGFVQVQRTQHATTLLMPDFAGNNAFNTLGNLARYPRAGLLFPDFASGDVLLLACTTQIFWDGPELARFHGAERLVALSVQSGWHFPRFMPFQWSEPVPGPQVEKT